ncbi:leucine-rich repeat protein [Alistipes putredinis]|uniref:leucine-rich repeat protein n=1 Tax=Alistipes putredinis TaxID=28117 RepID=UPI0026DBF1FF|nr:leucine-rich repeat protein [Alistipes putredinis]
MRKIITCMILGLLSLVSCTEYDEVAMWNKNEDMGSRLAALEELCSRLNTNIVSLQQIVEALQGNDYVTGVVPVVENGETVGYTISFSKSGPVTIYHGKKGENGQNGTTPVIGVEQDTDGLYYWTLDGEWLTDDEGSKILAQGMSGKSAYELAVEKGYRGTLDEWLASLNGSNGDDGKSAYELAVENGYQGTEEEWLASLKGNTGDDGKSAYELAVEKGYQGTEEEWLASLNGSNGDDGKSAYELAVENGYQGTEEEWLASLKGSAGDQGDDGVTPKLEVRDDGYWYISYDNGQTWNKLGPATGDPGEDGDSMFSDIDVSDPDYLVLTLAETGASIKLPYYKDKFDLLFVSGSDRVKEMAVYCGPGATAEVEYELTNPLNVQVAIECISHSGYKVAVDKSAKKITVSAPDDPAAITDPESEILVFASDDERTVMRKLVVKPVKYIVYKATRQLDWKKSFGDPRFWGGDCKFLDEQSTYDSATGEGRWAYTGTVIYITDAAFSGEAGLQEIVIPASVVEVGRNLLNETGGGGAFQNCTALTSVVFEGDNLSKINLNTFNGCSALSSIELPESLEKIEYNAFDDCSALKSIVIPDKVTYIGEGAFNYCTGLQEAYIGDGVTEIAAKAFAECTALKTVVIGKSIQRIGDQAFNTRSSWDQMTLEKITVLFDDVASGSFPVLESGSRGVFPKPGGWDPVSYKIYVPKGTKTEYQKNWSDYSSLIVEMQ